MKPIFSFALGLLLLAAPVHGQNMPVYSGPGSETANPQPPQQQEDQSVETLKVNVNIVQLFFNVKDKKGALIPSLTKDDFEIAEDGKPQTIKYFAAESDLPLTLGILIDASGSQMRVLDMEKQVGGDFLIRFCDPRFGVRDELRCECRALAGFHQFCFVAQTRHERRAHQHRRRRGRGYPRRRRTTGADGERA